MEALSFDKKSGVLKYSKAATIPELINENDVIVRVTYSGVCGTDLHIIEGAFPCNDKRCFVLGHEFCGIITETGKAARFQQGQRVVVDPNSGCGVCFACHCGKYHLCETGGINSTIGIWQDGGWAQYCRVPDTQIFSLPDEIPFDRGVLCEPLSCLARGWDRAGTISIGDDILIMGAGIIGNLWAALFHLQGHKNVTVSEPNKARLSASEKMGLNYTYVNPTDVSSQGKRYDIIIDCTGVAKAMEISLPLLKRSGKYVLFGCTNPKDSIIISPFDIYMKESSIVGVNINPFTFPKAIALLTSMGNEYLNYEKLGIGLFSLKEYTTAIQQLKTGEISKAVFKFD